MQLAEQFRPQHIGDLIGQQSLKQTLSGYLKDEDRSHAVLLFGPLSAGKTTCGRILAMGLLCEKPLDDGSACSECSSCVQFQAGSHPSFRELNSSSDRGIDMVRSLIETLSMRALGGGRKVYFFDECHQITDAAQNALLKSVEHPPEHVYFVFGTTNPEKMNAPLASRCTKVKLRGMTPDECTELLVRIGKANKTLAKSGLQKSHLAKIAHATQCVPRNAIHALGTVIALLREAQDGGQAVDDAVINQVISEVAVSDVDKTGDQIMRAILEGKPGNAIKRWDDNRDVADALFLRMLALSRQAMYATISTKLVDAYYAEAITGVGVLALPGQAALLTEIRKSFVQLYLDVISRNVNIADVADPLICGAALHCKKTIKATPPAEAEAPAEAPKKRRAAA